jgi:streptogramin lyase
MAVDRCGNVLITSADGQGTIAMYSAAPPLGQLITSWSATIPGEISANPSGITVDGSGNIWTIDWENAAVKEFSCPCTP